MRAGLRPWEVARCSPGDLLGWCQAHYGEDAPDDGMSQQAKADELMRRLRGPGR
jgi:hypothetical protein